MDVQREVIGICSDPDFRARIVELVLKLCEVDTCPAQPLESLAANEARAFAILQAALSGLGLEGGRTVRREISPAIRAHPAYSTPYYSAVPHESVYQGRGNLLYLLDREPAMAGLGAAVNAHIDTVTPHIPPALGERFIAGRGTADDKGNVAAVIGALQILAELERRNAVALKNKLTVMFAVDEETGGNGSLDLAMDRVLRTRYSSILIMECTGNRLHPANRGAVYLRCEARFAPSTPGGAPGACLAEAYAWALLALLDEGEAIRGESAHPLFPHRPVQTCTGILGPFGGHPSAICGEVQFELACFEPPKQEDLRALVEHGVRRYVARYGDKTLVLDPSTGRKKVEKHYDLDRLSAGRWLVTIHGSTGHMGSLPLNDAAIAKWSYVVRELVQARQAGQVQFSLVLPPAGAGPSLVFEGAQGFLPTHSIQEVKARTREAFLSGIRAYLAEAGLPGDVIACEVTFDKLHNDAFAGDPDSTSMQRARRTAVELGLPGAENPPVGWDVSCDARLFAGEYPDLPVITFGAGKLEQAHSSAERLDIDELFDAICFTALFLLRETGSTS